MQMGKPVTNLPHYANSCGVNALFITLSYLGAHSTNKLIQAMLDYVCNINSNERFGYALMQKFYETYELGNDFKSLRDLYMMIKDDLMFPSHVRAEIDDISNLIKLTPEELSKITLLGYDYGQYMSIVDDDTKDTEKIRQQLHSKDSSIFSVMTLNDVEFSNCIFVTCISYHYVVYVNTRSGLLVFNDLDEIRYVNREVLEHIAKNNKYEIEFVVALKL